MPIPEKTRADMLLVQRRLAPSRARARAEIEAGHVWTDGRCITKASFELPADAHLEVRGTSNPYVSRAALKLDFALSKFDVDVRNRIVLDIGASTGGFTEVCLERGASRVYAVDVGHGQLDPRISHDERVVALEGINAKLLTAQHIPEMVNLIVCDASFISLQKVLPTPLTFSSGAAHLVALIKPQFEVGPGHVGSDGVLRDEELHKMICANIERWVDSLPNWSVLGLCPSPISGSRGNKEYLIAAQKTQA